MFQQSPPASVIEALQSHGFDDQPILFSTSTDLSAEGRPEQQWLLLCGRRLVLLSKEKPRVLHTWTVDEAETFRTHAGVGSGFLQARIGGVWVDVVRYSNSLAGRFVKLAAKLEAIDCYRLSLSFSTRLTMQAGRFHEIEVLWDLLPGAPAGVTLRSR